MTIALFGACRWRRRVGKGARLRSLRASENLARRAHVSAIVMADRVGKIAPERVCCSRLATRDFAHPTRPGMTMERSIVNTVRHGKRGACARTKRVRLRRGRGRARRDGDRLGI